ncbi:protein trichome birefringence-like, partial [Dorcoceras hygrometricum]
SQKVEGRGETSWRFDKEKFLKSSEFETLCSEKTSFFFEHRFNGCLDQFRANGYSEKEHPNSLLDVMRALKDIPEEAEVAEGYT